MATERTNVISYGHGAHSRNYFYASVDQAVGFLNALEAVDPDAAFSVWGDLADDVHKALGIDLDAADDWEEEERLSPADEINEQLGYDADVSDPSQYCRHGTFIGSWWGPDYLCPYCESGE